MQSALDTGETLSENASPVEIVGEVAGIRANSSKTGVPGKVVLRYISPSRSGAQTKKPTRNLEGARVLSPLD